MRVDGVYVQKCVSRHTRKSQAILKKKNRFPFSSCVEKLYEERANKRMNQTELKVVRSLEMTKTLSMLIARKRDKLRRKKKRQINDEK